MKFDYNIRDVVDYINWDYFFYAWGMHDKPHAVRQALLHEAKETLASLDGKYRTHALFELCYAYSDGDDVVLPQKSITIPFLRQQQPGSDFLCLADFISPHSTTSPPLTSMLGVFATTVDMGLETDFDSDPYQKMMVQLLADRLAEATAEFLHEAVRMVHWGYACDETFTIEELHAEKFQGIRPAVGYPSLPDTSVNFLIDQLLNLRQIGIRLTESGAMKPHASVSGLMMAHPQSRYFSLGKIGDDQLRDYARRRGLPLEVMRKFLAANLS